eukprot:955705-Prorocentrum_minimum.AAC.1
MAASMAASMAAEGLRSGHARVRQTNARSKADRVSGQEGVRRESGGRMSVISGIRWIPRCYCNDAVHSPGNLDEQIPSTNSPLGEPSVLNESNVSYDFTADLELRGLHPGPPDPSKVV